MGDNPKSHRLELRIEAVQMDELEAVAHAREKKVADIVRERLDLGASIDRRFAELRRELIGAPLRPSSAPEHPAALVGASADQAMFVEILLLLRSMARPQQLHDAQSAVARLGLDLWTASEAK